MACEEFVQDLRKSNVLRRGQLDKVLQLINQFLKENRDADAPAVADYLIEKEVLSNYQAEALLQGKAQALIYGQYVIIERLGPGVVGTIYRTYSKHNEEVYYLEVLPQRAKWNIYLAYRQKKAFAQIEHPAVVPFVDVGTASGSLFLVWPTVEGERLDSIVQRNIRLKPSVAADYVLKAAEGLHACHIEGVFHGLLTPTNVLRDAAGHIHIIAFGIGSLLAEKEGESLLNTMSTSNALNAALDCASPESMLDPSERNPLGDQYSLACVLYFCLAGRFPFAEQNTMKKLMAVQYEQPTPIRELNSNISQPLADVLERAMQKNPQDRFHDMLEFASALRAAIRAGGDALASGAHPALGPSTRKTPVPGPPTGKSSSGIMRPGGSGIQKSSVGGSGVRKSPLPGAPKGPTGSGVRRVPPGSGIQRGSGIRKPGSGVRSVPGAMRSAGGPDLLDNKPASKWSFPVILVAIGVIAGILGTALIVWLTH
jgi:serine/threonine-protein kinase